MPADLYRAVGTTTYMARCKDRLISSARLSLPFSRISPSIKHNGEVVEIHAHSRKIKLSGHPRPSISTLTASVRFGARQRTVATAVDGLVRLGAERRLPPILRPLRCASRLIETRQAIDFYSNYGPQTQAGQTQCPEFTGLLCGRPEKCSVVPGIGRAASSLK